MRIGSELSNFGTLNANSATSGSSQLHKSAHEFEGLLFNSIWKEAQEGLDGDEENDGLSIRMDGPLQAIGFQSLIGEATKSGGLGIAALIEKSLAKSQPAGSNGAAIKDPGLGVDPAGIFDLRLGGGPGNPKF